MSSTWSVELARAGLVIRPDAASLLNNRAFALANLDRLDEADHALNKLTVGPSDLQYMISQANRGLIAFRRNDIVEGLARYKSAIELFERAHLAPFALTARAYLAREAARARVPDAPKMVADLKSDVEKSDLASLRRVYSAAEQLLIEAARDLSPAH